MKQALLPFSGLYTLILLLRDLAFRYGLLQIRKLPVPVISVGNLTLGGSGKTPCTLHLAEKARSRNMQAVILTRGYKGRFRGTGLVSDQERVLLGPADAGDEAYLLARMLPGTPVVKCPDRYAGGILAVERFKPDLFLLDDGFQHRRLHRDINILLMNDGETLLKEALFPAGQLREPLSAIRRADEIVMTSPERERDNQLPEGLRTLAGEKPVSVMSYAPESLVDASGAILPAQALKGEKVLAFCGIAHPHRFRKTLNDLSADVIEFQTFRDHYAYSETDLSRITERARALSVDRIVTTEKDLAKLSIRDIWAVRMKTGLAEEMLDRVFNSLGAR